MKCSLLNFKVELTHDRETSTTIGNQLTDGEMQLF